ncbi:hypothetical protein H8959_003887 [Pygathrix nigripes]
MKRNGSAYRESCEWHYLWELDNDVVGNAHHIVHKIKCLGNYSFRLLGSPEFQTPLLRKSYTVIVMKITNGATIITRENE